MNRLTADMIRDPRWFPMRFDVAGDRFQLVRMTAEMHRAVTFLGDIRPSESEVRFVARGDAEQVPVVEAPLHLIVHSGLGGSTLLARALAQPGVVTTLKEPPVLTDVIAFGLRGAAPDQQTLLQQTARLLARPFAVGEAVAIKMSSIGNGLAEAIAEDRPSSQMLCLQTPLDLMLASLASRGSEGRIGGRRLFTGMRNAGMIAAEPGDLPERSDLELAALAWLSIQKKMVDAAKLGSARVRSLESEQLMARPRDALAAVAAHFRLALDVDARLASGVFSRHAKTGQAFDARIRAQRMQATLREHGAEIGNVVGWARKIADANGIAWDLPYPLLD